MRYKVLFLAFFLLAATNEVFSQNVPEDVVVRLALSGGKTKFRIGEPVRMTLSFTAGRGDYVLEQYSSKPGSSHEEILISPRTGVFDWSKQYLRGNPRNDHVSSELKLSETPAVVEMALNDFVRFDTPGQYSVRVKTKRISKATFPINASAPTNATAKIELTTNEVRFEIREMTEADELIETKKLSAMIEAATGNWQEQTRLAAQLSYLPGVASTREKVRRFLNPLANVPGNYSGEIRWGLFIARDRELVIELLEEALSDTSREVEHGLLHTLSNVRVLHESVGTLSYTDERYRETLNSYLAELVESFPRRKGIPRAAAAITVLQNLPRENPPLEELSKIREILLADFDTFNLYSREYLLRSFWDTLKDPSLVPSIERMLDETNTLQTYNPYVRPTAIERLIEMDKAKARRHVVDDILIPNSTTNVEILSRLDDKFLPEVDDALMEQISAHGNLRSGHIGNVQIKLKSLLAARYATAKIYDRLKGVYTANGDRWFSDSRAAMLGYFARHNEAEAMPLIEHALAKMDSGAEFSFLIDLTRMNYPRGVDRLLRNRLSGDNVAEAGTAAYLMSKHGTNESRKLIQIRLDRWISEWRTKRGQLDANNDHAMLSEGMFQINLIQALRDAKAWKLSNAEYDRLKQGCLSKRCLDFFRIR